MPHVVLFAVEEQLVGREAELVAVLTDAVVSLYDEWARSIRSTRGLSCGERTLAGSVTNPACWE